MTIKLEITGRQIKIASDKPFSEPDIDLINSIKGSVFALSDNYWLIYASHIPEVVGYFRNRQDAELSTELAEIAKKQPRTQYEIEKRIIDEYNEALKELNEWNESGKWKTNPEDYKTIKSKYIHAYRNYLALQKRKKEIGQIGLFGY